MAGMEASDKRVTLVVDNSNYRHANVLQNPANDAKAISEALTRLEFSGAKPRFNLDYNGLRRALLEFGTEADGADMAVIYFAGHGVEVDSRNFLIPVDAKLERSRDVDFETASLDQALNSVDGARQLRRIILDACRNNPFRTRMRRSGGARSIGQGLRSIEPGGNVLVAYAAKHGTIALDGKNSNSPFEDPVLPDNGFGGRNWRDDIQLTLQKQDDVRVTQLTGNIFLTNIHRLNSGDDNTMDYFFGKRPTGAATDSSVDLSIIVSDIDELMVLNDEAHHIHDSKLAWFKSIDDRTPQTMVRTHQQGAVRRDL